MAKLSNDEESPISPLSDDGNYQPKKKQPYRNLGTDLTLDDMSSSGVHKLLLAENSRLETENYDLLAECKQAHVLRVNNARITEELRNLKRTNKFLETLYAAGLGGGTALLGISISVQPLVVSIAVGLLGLSLFVIAIVARSKRHED